MQGSARRRRQEWRIDRGIDGADLRRTDNGGISIAAAAPETDTLLFDDFENGSGEWDTDRNWSIVDEGGNHVLQGTNHAWATLIDREYWTDYTFEADIKIGTGAVQLMLRMTDDRGRYIVGITPGGMYLDREFPWEKIEEDLDSSSGAIAINTWHHVLIEANLKEITVYLDDRLHLDYSDGWTKTLWQGSIGLEVVPWDWGSGSI